MAERNLKTISRTALLLALTIMFQSLRVIIPLPALMSTFLIGTLVNASLLISIRAVGLRPAMLIACVTPLVAWLQQLLPLPVFVVPVAMGNCLYVWLFYRLQRAGPEWAAIGSAAMGKAAFFYLAFAWLLSWLSLPPSLAKGLLFVMGWPQLVTGIAGGVVSVLAWKRIRKAIESK